MVGATRDDVCFELIKYCQLRLDRVGNFASDSFAGIDGIIGGVARGYGSGRWPACVLGCDAFGGSGCKGSYLQLESGGSKAGLESESSSVQDVQSSAGSGADGGNVKLQKDVSGCQCSVVADVFGALCRGVCGVHEGECVGVSGVAVRQTEGEECGSPAAVVPGGFVGVESSGAHDVGGDRSGLEHGAVDVGVVPEWRKEAGPLADVGSVSVGEGTIANRKRRAQRKARKFRKQALQFSGAFASCSVEIKKELADTRARRYIAENKEAIGKIQRNDSDLARKIRGDKEALLCANLRRDLELVQTVDFEKLKKRRDVKIVRDTELSKVQIEKAYGALSCTDNMPSVQGSVRTIVSGSISPNSSVSEAEVRKLQKDYTDAKKAILDVKKLNDQLVAKLGDVREAAKHSDCANIIKIVDEDCDAMYAASAGVSLDEDGIPLGALDIGGEGTYYDGYIDDYGRFHHGSKELGNWF